MRRSTPNRGSCRSRGTNKTFRTFYSRDRCTVIWANHPRRAQFAVGKFSITGAIGVSRRRTRLRGDASLLAEVSWGTNISNEVVRIWIVHLDWRGGLHLLDTVVSLVYWSCYLPTRVRTVIPPWAILWITGPLWTVLCRLARPSRLTRAGENVGNDAGGGG